jgi:MOSC domain-containing protein YiiM
MTGQLLAIWLKSMRRGPMLPRQHAELKAGRGIVDNTDQGGRRQVTILSSERWDHVTGELGAELEPSKRRANFLVSSIELEDTRGRTLRIGGCRLRVLGETRPCERMDEALPGLQEAMRRDWAGGVFAEVLDDGEVRVGDEVAWEVEE